MRTFALADGRTLKDFQQPAAAFEQAIGRMVLRWAELEGSLAHLLNSIIDGRDTWRGRSLYFATGNLGPRLDVVDTSLRQLAIHDPRFAPCFHLWRKLRDKVDKEARERRNQIVHGQLVHETNMEKLTVHNFVQPYFGDQIYGDGPLHKKRKAGFTLAQIEQTAVTAEKLSLATQILTEAIEATRHSRTPSSVLGAATAALEACSHAR